MAQSSSPQTPASQVLLAHLERQENGTFALKPGGDTALMGALLQAARDFTLKQAIDELIAATHQLSQRLRSPAAADAIVRVLKALKPALEERGLSATPLEQVLPSHKAQSTLLGEVRSPAPTPVSTRADALGWSSVDSDPTKQRG